MKSKLTDVVIVGYGRSAVAKSGKKGALRETHPVNLGGLVLRGVLDKIENLPDEAIDDIIVGCAQQEIGQTFNIGRLVAQRAGCQIVSAVCPATVFALPDFRQSPLPPQKYKPVSLMSLSPAVWNP